MLCGHVPTAHHGTYPSLKGPGFTMCQLKVPSTTQSFSILTDLQQVVPQCAANAAIAELYDALLGLPHRCLPAPHCLCINPNLCHVVHYHRHLHRQLAVTDFSELIPKSFRKCAPNDVTIINTPYVYKKICMGQIRHWPPKARSALAVLENRMLSGQQPIMRVFKYMECCCMHKGAMPSRVLGS